MKAIQAFSIILAGSLALSPNLIADTITIQFFLGNVSDTPEGAIGVLVADVNSDGFDSVYQAGIDGNTLNVGDTFANSDDIVIGVTTATSDGFQGNDIGFADTFEPIDYAALGLSQGIPVRFFWFPSANRGSPVVATYMGFQAFNSGSNGVGGNLNYTGLPAAPGVYTLTHLDTSNGGGIAQISPSPTGFTGPIATQPMNATVDGGDSATVSVGTQGLGPYSFEWFMGPAGDTSNPVGTNSDTLNLLSLLYDSSYWVRITDSSGTINSMVANLTVNGGGLRPDFTWNQVQGAEWYNLYIQKDGELYLSEWFEGSNVTSWTPGSNLPIGNYIYWVRTFSAAGGYTPWVQISTFSLGIPELLTPAGAQPSNEARPEFTWTRGLGADSYVIYVARDGALFYTGTIQGFTNTSWRSQTDMPPGKYSYWIAPVSAETGQGPWSTNPLEFSIGIPQPIAPSGTLPEGDWRPNFTWSQSPSAEWYYLYIQLNGSLWQTFWIEGSANNSWRSASNMPVGNYTFWVAPWTAQGGQGPWSDSMSFTIGPSLPNPVSPDGLQDLGISQPAFTWTGGLKNEWFQLYLSRNGALVTEPWIQGPASSWTPPSELRSGNYNWWIRGWSTVDGNTAWTRGPDFEIQGLTQISPIDVTTGGRPEFSWHADPGATFYRIYLARIPEEGGFLVFNDWLEGVTNWTPDSELTVGNYEWWIQAYHPTTGSGPWLGPVNFNVQRPLPSQDSSLLTSTSIGGSIEVASTASHSFEGDLENFGGNLELATGTSSSNGAKPVATPGDFNEDGFSDLILQNKVTGETKIILMNGANAIGVVYLAVQTGDPSWKIVGHGDMDRDLDNDLIWQNSESGKVLAWNRETGSGIINSLPLNGISLSLEDKVVGFADANGNGSNDLIVQNSSLGQLEAIELDSFTATATNALSHTEPTGWLVDATLDLDGDGTLDLFWRHPDSGMLELPIENAASSLAAGERFVAAQDMNNDGEIDLVIQNAISGELSVWHLTGGTVTSEETLSYQPESADWEVRNSRPIE